MVFLAQIGETVVANLKEQVLPYAIDTTLLVK